MSREPNLYIILSTCKTKDYQTESIRNFNESERKLLENPCLWMPSRKKSKQEIHALKNELAYWESERVWLIKEMMLDRRTSKCGCSRLSAKEKVTHKEELEKWLIESSLMEKHICKARKWSYGKLEDGTWKSRGEAPKSEVKNKLWWWMNKWRWIRKDSEKV